MDLSLDNYNKLVSIVTRRVNMFTSTIDLIRRGALTAPPEVSGAALRVIQIAEIYPYHLCRYPDRDDLESCLSCKRLPDPFDNLLEQTFAALEAHSDSFPNVGSAPPSHIMNLAASLSLQITQIPNPDPKKSIENGVMYLNKILHTSPYITIHQFLLDAYMASTKINEHVKIRFNKQGSTDNIKKFVIRVYEGLLKLEVDIKEAWYKDHPILTRTENTISQAVHSGLTNPCHAVLGQEIGLDQETLASLAQAAMARGAPSCRVDPAISEGQGGPATLDCQVAEAFQGGQAVQAPPAGSYNLLGIESLEMGCKLGSWDKGFERKLRSIFEEFGLGCTNWGDVYPLGELSYAEGDEYEDDD